MFPHEVRMNLMNTHLQCDDISELLILKIQFIVFLLYFLGQLCDLSCHTKKSHPSHLSNPYFVHWHYVASQNSEIYDEIERSLYRSTDIQTFVSLIQRFEFLTLSQKNIPELLKKIQGKLVLWSPEFLMNEIKE